MKIFDGGSLSLRKRLGSPLAVIWSRVKTPNDQGGPLEAEYLLCPIFPKAREVVVYQETATSKRIPSSLPPKVAGADKSSPIDIRR